jgi:class 3 adenylate cyclase
MTYKANILVVDDTPANLQLLCSLLATNGYEARPLLNGRTALNAAQVAPPDLILLDITMPEMDGYTVCEQLKANPLLRAIPVIFISALNEVLDKVRAFTVGGVDYITKPFQVEEVLVRVDTQLQLARQHRELQHRYEQIQQLQGMLQQFVSQSAWQRIAADALQTHDTGPQLRRLTIMVTDVAGYTALSEQTDLGRLVADLSIYMSNLTQIIHDHGGEIDKYMGDGVMAFFANAEDAVRAALTIQRTLANCDVGQTGHQLPTRIGLATGNVLLTKLGGSSRQEYTLIGDRVNVAARIQAEVGTGGVIMDANTYRDAGCPPSLEERSLKLRGKSISEFFYTLQMREAV